MEGKERGIVHPILLGIGPQRLLDHFAGFGKALPSLGSHVHLVPLRKIGHPEDEKRRSVYIELDILLPWVKVHNPT